MNGEDRNDLKLILQRMDEGAIASEAANKIRDGERAKLIDGVQTLHTNLFGEEGDHTKDGLVGDVNRNTAWRRIGSKIVMGIVVAIISLTVKAIWFSTASAASP